MSDAVRRRDDESRPLPNERSRDDLVVIDPQVEQPDPDNPHRASYSTHHAVKYLLTEEGWAIDPDQTITAEVDTTPKPGEPTPTDPPVNVDIPMVSGPNGIGDASEGQTLTCTMGNWHGVPTSYDYAWQVDGSPNSAVGDTYNVAAGDAGHSITCVVTAANAIGATTAPASNPIAVA